MHVSSSTGAEPLQAPLLMPTARAGEHAVSIVPDAGTSGRDEKLVDATRKFESILTRQLLSESMKPLLQDGPGGQVYGYFLTDTLADSLSKGGGLGLSSVFQAQLGVGKEGAL